MLNKLKTLNKTTYAIIAGTLLLLIIIGGGIGFAYSSQQSSKPSNDSNSATENSSPVESEEETSTIKNTEVKDEKAPDIADLETVPQTTATVVAKKSYTNEFLPGFEVAYPEDWKFETTTEPSFVKGIVQRTIKLSKNNSELQLFIIPQSLGGCSFGVDKPTFRQDKNLNNGFYKYVYTSDGDIFTNDGAKGNLRDLVRYSTVDTKEYTQLGCAENKINSTLEFRNYPEYEQNTSGKIQFSLSINPTFNDADPVRSNDPLIEEIDQIVAGIKLN